MISGRVFSLGVLPLSPDICAIVGSTKNCGLRAPGATQASPPPVRTTPAPTAPDGWEKRYRDYF